jgi:hypothetical protein
MDTILDALVSLLRSGSGPLLLAVLVFGPLLAIIVFRTRGGLQRRRDFESFAEARGLRFAGTIASDARAPYDRVGTGKWAVLLYHVVEGTWDGLPVSVFDMPRGKRPTWTVALVTANGLLRDGKAAARVRSATPGYSAEANLDVLYVTPERQIEVTELPDLLDCAVSLVKAMEQDAREETPAGTGPQRR